MRADFSFQRAALRDLFQSAQRAHMEVTSSKARLVEDLTQSRELMEHADLLLTLPYLK